jgi:dTDP-4-amino-4,6-dideoxygalactose transaminase
VLTNDKALADRCRDLRNLCFDKERRFIHEDHEQCSSGDRCCSARADQIVAKKRQIGQWYQRRLRGHPRLQLPPERTDRSGEKVVRDVATHNHGQVQLGEGAAPVFAPWARGASTQMACQSN